MFWKWFCSFFAGWCYFLFAFLSAFVPQSPRRRVSKSSSSTWTTKVPSATATDSAAGTATKAVCCEDGVRLRHRSGKRWGWQLPQRKIKGKGLRKFCHFFVIFVQQCFGNPLLWLSKAWPRKAEVSWFSQLWKTTHPNGISDWLDRKKPGHTTKNFMAMGRSKKKSPTGMCQVWWVYRSERHREEGLGFSRDLLILDMLQSFSGVFFFKRCMDLFSWSNVQTISNMFLLARFGVFKCPQAALLKLDTWLTQLLPFPVLWWSAQQLFRKSLGCPWVVGKGKISSELSNVCTKCL